MFYFLYFSFKNRGRIFRGFKERKFLSLLLLTITLGCLLHRPQFIFPLEGRIIRMHGRGHKGIDIEAKEDKIVKAAESGQVVAVKEGMGRYKTVVIVKHPRRVFTVYANLLCSYVKEGEAVRKGEKIGKVEDFLHFEVRIEKKPEDPLLFLNP